MGIVQIVGKKLMLTESEWNPKVIAGRALTSILPASVLRQIMKHYYALVLARAPSDWAENDRAVVEQFLTRDDEVVDVGASIGVYTKFLSGIAKRVYSFEPNPEIYDFLAYNVRKLGLSNVETYPCALSDSARTDKMVIPRYRWGSECHYDATLDFRQEKVGIRSIDVQVQTMDSILFRKGVSFIKCDVNGHELRFLLGAMQTIRMCRPVILMELLQDPEEPASDTVKVFSLLEQAGYTVCLFDGKLLRKRQRGERSQNYFFLPTPVQNGPLTSTHS